MKKFVGVNLFFIVILSFTIHAMTVFGLDGADVNGQYGKMVTGIRVPETICSCLLYTSYKYILPIPDMGLSDAQ